MIYQVIASILFDDQDQALDFYHDCGLALAKGTTINTNQPNPEFSHIDLAISNHEQDPNQESTILHHDDNRSPPPE